MASPAPAPAPRSLDRRSGDRRDPALLAAALARPGTRVLDVAADRVHHPVDDGEVRRLRWHAPEPPEAPGSGNDLHIFLAQDDLGTAYLARLLPPTASSAPSGPSQASGADGGPGWVPLREVASWLGPLEAELGMTAVGMARWHGRHGFCPGCGAPSEPAAAGWVRRCTADGSEHFPRTDPAVIVAVVDAADRLLLGRGPTFKQGWVSVLAGFVEPGETLEGAVIREIAEEVGVVVGDVTYAGSQPWPFPSSLMIGFTARARESALTPDPEEIAEVDWYSRERLAAEVGAGRLGIPGRLSIARRLIEGWYGGPLRQHREPTTIRTDLS